MFIPITRPNCLCKFIEKAVQRKFKTVQLKYIFVSISERYNRRLRHIYCIFPHITCIFTRLILPANAWTSTIHQPHFLEANIEVTKRGCRKCYIKRNQIINLQQKLPICPLFWIQLPNLPDLKAISIILSQMEKERHVAETIAESAAQDPCKKETTHALENRAQKLPQTQSLPQLQPIDTQDR